ncbi:MAG: GNAT family N-acetyltransferase [Tannerella sp.]|jgi:GNAT superfamily N-acetyltransferase|nr:GNAT family N-acetyltransferase [Tannerella sp.]
MRNDLEYPITLLTPETAIAPFDCGDADLNDFLANDAIAFLKERLAVTHLMVFETNDEIVPVSYFCLLTDKLMFNLSDEDKKKAWKTFNKKNKIHYNKHRKSYPAVKIGRLAVSQSFAGQGIGRILINYIIGIVTEMNTIGCRFITVDAYQSAFDFYLKNEFDFLSDEDENETTRVMYFDLKRLFH